jgi:tetratricopeptide (TPR) repeat protein
MTFAHLLWLVLLGASGPGAPQASALDRGLAAESANRWDDALSVYRADLERDSRQLALWIRVADIHARLRQRQAAIDSLTRAAAVFPQSDAVHVRLSEAYGEAGDPAAAYASIARALAIRPASVDYLRRHARLATWAGDYDAAKRSYRQLLHFAPGDTDAQLGLARTSAWSGDTDAAVQSYWAYLGERPDHPEVWIELARAESWRGNFAAALDVLDTYRSRFGDSGDSLRERVGVLARGGRPRQATRLMAPLLAETPDDVSLNLSKAVAFAAQQRRGDAFAAFESVTRLQRANAETRGAQGLLRAVLASTGTPAGSFYSDSDGLSTWRFDPRVNIAVGDHLRMEGGYERLDLQAKAGSGLEGPLGGRRSRHELGWLGASLRTGPFVWRGQAGRAKADDRTRLAYEWSAALTSDHVQVTASRESGFFVVSPRTVALGLERTTDRVHLGWSPSLRYYVSVDAAHDALSDGNDRWDILLAPRRAVTRTQRLNLDLGLQARHLSTARNLENGYYDPSRYESYSVVAFPYWKVSENAGIGALAAVGVQRDDTSEFGLMGNAATEATFGIYRDWMLKLNGSVTVNNRLASGAFRGYGGQLVLVRRF